MILCLYCALSTYERDGVYMSISSISSATSSFSYGNDSEIKQLQNQLKNLQKQLNAENSSKDDAKTKQAKVQTLEAQIAQIEAQIQQIQTKKTNQSGSSEQATQTNSNLANTDASTITSNNKIDVQA